MNFFRWLSWFFRKPKINVMLDKGSYMPERAHRTDAGYDIRSPKEVLSIHGEAIVIDTGVHMLIPEGFAGMLKSKSGLNVKNDLTGEGVVDAGYTGSIVVKLYNNGEKDHFFDVGDKLIQIVIVPVFTPFLKLVDSMDDTERGDKGFGSTGR